MFPIDIPAFVRKARETDTLIEISSLGRSARAAKATAWQSPGKPAAGREAILNSDAHICTDIELNQAQARSTRLPEEQIMNTDPTSSKPTCMARGKSKIP